MIIFFLKGNKEIDFVWGLGIKFNNEVEEMPSFQGLHLFKEEGVNIATIVDDP